MHRLICSKGPINKKLLFGDPWSNKICELKPLVAPYITINGNIRPNDNFLVAGLHKALDIKSKPSDITWSQIGRDLYDSEYTEYYIVEPHAVEELMLQKLQDNPALYTDFLGFKVKPARILKLQSNWYEEWIIAEIMSRRKHTFSISRNQRYYINHKFGLKRGNELIRKAHKRIEGILRVRNLISKLEYPDVSNAVVDAISFQIKEYVVAK